MTYFKDGRACPVRKKWSHLNQQTGMDKYELTEGKGRTEVRLLAHYLKDDLVLCIYNENAHIGAVAVGEYDHKEKRASTSVLTRLGHKDDAIAQKAAYLISKSTRKPVCVVAGVHLDNITRNEIDRLVANANSLIEKFLKSLTAETHT